MRIKRLVGSNCRFEKNASPSTFASITDLTKTKQIFLLVNVYQSVKSLISSHKYIYTNIYKTPHNKQTFIFILNTYINQTLIKPQITVHLFHGS